MIQDNQFTQDEINKIISLFYQTITDNNYFKIENIDKNKLEKALQNILKNNNKQKLTYLLYQQKIFQHIKDTICDTKNILKENLVNFILQTCIHQIYLASEICKEINIENDDALISIIFIEIQNNYTLISNISNDLTKSMFNNFEDVKIPNRSYYYNHFKYVLAKEICAISKKHKNENENVKNKIDFVFIKDAFIMHIFKSIILKYEINNEQIINFNKKINDFIKKEQILKKIVKYNSLTNLCCATPTPIYISNQKAFETFVSNKLENTKILLKQSEKLNDDEQNVFYAKHITIFQKKYNHYKHIYIICGFCTLILFSICLLINKYLNIKHIK